MLFVYIGLSILLGIKTQWWVGLLAFLVIWTLSFVWGIYNIKRHSHADEAAEMLNRMGTIKNAVIVTGMIIIIFSV